MLRQAPAHGQHPPGEGTADLALRPKTDLPPEHSRTKRPLGRVVGRLNRLMVEERPVHLPHAGHGQKRTVPVFATTLWGCGKTSRPAVRF
jgi:hypothetical protein